MDERLRELQRLAAGGDPEARASFLAACVRSGELSEHRLRLAAALGDPVACALYGGSPSEPLPDQRYWAEWIAPCGKEAAVRIATSVVRELIQDHWLALRPKKDRRALDALEAAEAWLEDPGKDTARRAMEVAAAAHPNVNRRLRPPPSAARVLDAAVNAAEAAAQLTTTDRPKTVEVTIQKLDGSVVENLIRIDQHYWAAQNASQVISPYAPWEGAEVERVREGLRAPALLGWLLAWEPDREELREEFSPEERALGARVDAYEQSWNLVRLAAYLGDPIARGYLHDETFKPPAKLKAFVQGIQEWGKEPLVRAALAAVRLELGEHPDPRAEPLVAAAEAWLASPGPHTARAATQAERQAPRGVSKAASRLTSCVARTRVRGAAGYAAGAVCQVAKALGDEAAVREGVSRALIEWALQGRNPT